MDVSILRKLTVVEYLATLLVFCDLFMCLVAFARVTTCGISSAHW